MKDVVNLQNVEKQASLLRCILDTAATEDDSSNELTRATSSIHSHSSSLSMAILNIYCKFSNGTFM
jgi:hypothetical protein